MSRTSLLIVTYLVQFLCACTIINVEGVSGHSSTVHVGNPHRIPKADGGITAYHVKVFGLGILPTGPVLGFGSADAVHAKDLSQCRMIIFELPSDPQQARLWRELIGNRADVCTLDKGTDNEPN